MFFLISKSQHKHAVSLLAADFWVHVQPKQSQLGPCWSKQLFSVQASNVWVKIDGYTAINHMLQRLSQWGEQIQANTAQ